MKQCQQIASCSRFHLCKVPTQPSARVLPSARAVACRDGRAPWPATQAGSHCVAHLWQHRSLPAPMPALLQHCHLHVALVAPSSAHTAMHHLSMCATVPLPHMWPLQPLMKHTVEVLQAHSVSAGRLPSLPCRWSTQSPRRSLEWILCKPRSRLLEALRSQIWALASRTASPCPRDMPSSAE